MRRLSARNLSLVLALGALPMFAAAQSDNHGVQRSAHGLGQAYPDAADRSADPEWRLYIFERDGFSYFQINDLNGHVEAIIGKAGDTYWVLPAGESAVHVSAQASALPNHVVRVRIYRGSGFSLVRYGRGEDASWAVEVDS